MTSSIHAVTGKFQCDCRGVGVDWQVAEVRRIAQALLGTVDIIPSADKMAEVFDALMQQSMSRGVADAELRVWAPQGSQVMFVRQVSPNVEDLTQRRVEVNPLTGGYPTGSWADESRDYHVSVRLSAKGIGQEQLAARVQLAVGGAVQAQGLVKAKWSSDEGLTTRINPEVAHYTGQTELAEAIQEGLAAKAAGDDAGATTKLGRAVQLAAQTGNEEVTTRLRKVVDIDNVETGTVRLKRSIDKADEMALDTASTKTTRVRNHERGVSRPGTLRRPRTTATSAGCRSTHRRRHRPHPRRRRTCPPSRPSRAGSASPARTAARRTPPRPCSARRAVTTSPPAACPAQPPSQKRPSQKRPSRKGPGRRPTVRGGSTGGCLSAAARSPATRPV